MFDIGIFKLLVVGIVALVVIGPERLPRVARTAGLLLGRMQRYVNDVKADISREMQIEELKRLRSEVEQSAFDLEQRISRELRAAEQNLAQEARGVHDEVSAALADAEKPAALPHAEAALPEAKNADPAASPHPAPALAESADPR
ncbi:MAG: Sec-independent protein translocase protein TatB [Betaproteobacteria bacterium]|nr:Sec-independent protein translocase protein TatB [Betaproteobacteria bacterium]